MTRPRFMMPPPEARLWGLLQAALVAGVGAWMASQSFFHSDDFLYARLFQQLPNNQDTLLRSYFGHLVPGFVMLCRLLYVDIGLSWGVAATFMVAVLVVGSLTVTRLVAATIGRTTVHARLAGLAFALNPSSLPLASYWGAAVTVLLPLVLGLLATEALVRWCRRPRVLTLVWLGVAYALALAFFEKSVLFSAYMFLWATFVLDARLGWGQRLRSALRRWPAWLLIAALTLVDLYVYLTGPYREGGGAGPTAQEVLGFSGIGIWLGTLPGALGLDLQLMLPPAADIVVAVLVLAAFVLGLVVAGRRDRSSLVIALLGLLPMLLLAQVPTAIGRFVYAGLEGGRLLRYQVEAITMLLAGAAVIAASAGRVRGRRAVPRPTRLAAVGVVVLLAVSLWSSTLSLAASPGPASRTFVDNLRREWPATGAVRMLDGPLHTDFTFGWQYPYNRRSSILPLLVDRAEFVPSVEGTVAVDSAGHVGPGAFEVRQSFPGEGRCATPGSPVVVTLPAFPDQLDLRLVMTADQPGTAMLGLGTSPSNPVPGAEPVRFHPGTTTLTGHWSSALPSVTLTAGLGKACLQRLDVGIVTPTR